ncbi:peroxisomal membrane protein 11C-like isoform X2 [Portunus trituberculatus]|uniref:peroxisomal membrane protein 11C-like isoform X2 n=1 Tax=Portunus trituberculatus TaxID=210409 RepID=UPI001E1CE3AB|nr:peroxisomal membrane protein 11C-like isoform X2 [Portunus trituberculatus]
MGLDDVVGILENYRGREKTLRTLQYGLLFITPAARHSPSTKAVLEGISAQIGGVRVILRLFDDLSMFQYSKAVLKQSKEKDWIVRWLEVANIVVDQLFFPVEHLAWARDVKILRGSSSSLWHASLLLWATSLVLTILRSLQKIFLLKQNNSRLQAEEKDRQEEKYEAELLTIIMHAADLLNALNWLPNRPWSKSFPVWQVGVFGLVSSLIGFQKLLQPRL